MTRPHQEMKVPIMNVITSECKALWGLSFDQDTLQVVLPYMFL